MSKYKYSETERQINSVLKHQDEDLKSIHFPSLSEADATVAKADALLRRLGYQPDAIKGLVPVQPRKINGYPYLGAMLRRSRNTRRNGLRIGVPFHMRTVTPQ